MNSFRRSIAVISAVSVLGLGALAPEVLAAAKSGASCAKVGATEGSLVCKKVGKVNRWVKATAATTVAATTVAPTTLGGPAPTTAAPIADFPLTGDSQGVTDTTVKIGIISVVNRGGSAALSTAVGDEKAQIAATVDFINDNGGIAGRKVIAVIKEMNVAGNTFAQSPVICASLVDDEKVFAVILQAHTFVFERECYTRKKVLVIDPSNVSYDESVYKKLQPFFYSTAVPSLSRVMPSLMKEAKAGGYFDGTTKIGVWALNTPDDKAFIEGTFTNELKKAGIDSFEVAYSGFDRPETFFIDAGKAIGRFQAAGVNKVVLMGAQGLGVAFVQVAEASRYFPRYLTHSNETPRYMMDTPTGFGLKPLQPGTLDGAIGIGWTPYQDADDVHLPFPQPGAETVCIGALRARGIAFASRNLARYALGFCDGLEFMQAAAKPLKNLNVQAFAVGAGKLGTSFAGPGSYKTNFTPGRFDGGGGYRVFKWDNTCTRIADANGNPKVAPSGGCWGFTSGVKDF
jgi:ABC-type branched-subunit amino acid transport system substrate-binding protein